MNRTDEIDEKGIREGRSAACAGLPVLFEYKEGDWYEKEMGGNQFGSGNGFAMYGMFSNRGTGERGYFNHRPGGAKKFTRPLSGTVER